MKSLELLKKEQIAHLEEHCEKKVLEKSNVELLRKLIQNADTGEEVLAIASLGTVYKRTGFHYDHRIEKHTDTVKCLEKNEKLSFGTSKEGLIHKLIIGDNYSALQNLMITYMGKVDVIYIDPPYGKDKMGVCAKTNYDNAITRDNLLSMLEPRLRLAKQLLSEGGVIFCSIDDRNQAYFKCLFDEIFDESNFLLNIPRITKKGGKSTQTIAKNNDYIIAYTKNNYDIKFSQEEKTDIAKYKYEDEYVDTRGKYALTQTLDYNSLQYNATMDFEIDIDGVKFYPGGSKDGMEKRHNGQHGNTDWVWRWSASAVQWGKKQNLFVVKNGRIYTKSYLYCRKVNGKNELEMIDATKAYTTLSFLDNKYSNDNATKELDTIFENSSTLFKNPKPTALISELIKMVCTKEDAIILDFYAGSGTTGQAVLEMNRRDGGKRKFILVTNNEEEDGKIAYNVTSKRLKRVMTGKCYDGTKDFKWIENNEPYGDNLEVTEIIECDSTDSKIFDSIDETLYGLPKFADFKEKAKWICENFDRTDYTLLTKKEK